MTRSVTDWKHRRRAGRSITLARNPCPFAATPIEHELTLPDGRTAQVRVGMAHDGYIPEREEETVVLEVRIGRFVEATLNTVLDPDQDDAAAELAREVVEALAVGARRADGERARAVR